MNHGDKSIFDADNDQHERIMNQSNTPRTDKMLHDYFSNEISSRELSESIAQLETELADAQKANGEALRTVQRYMAELKAANERADVYCMNDKDHAKRLLAQAAIIQTQAIKPAVDKARE